MLHQSGLVHFWHLVHHWGWCVASARWKACAWERDRNPRADPL